MQITTTFEIVPNHMDPKDGQLRIQVHVNGEPGGTSVYLSGNLGDIRQFAAGEIDLAEIRRRWGFKS